MPAEDLVLNGSGRPRSRAADPSAAGPYARDRRTGAFLVSDPQSGQTLAEGMLGAPLAGKGDHADEWDI